MGAPAPVSTDGASLVPVRPLPYTRGAGDMHPVDLGAEMVCPGPTETMSTDGTSPALPGDGL